MDFKDRYHGDLANFQFYRLDSNTSPPIVLSHEATLPSFQFYRLDSVLQAARSFNDMVETVLSILSIRFDSLVRQGAHPR